MNRQAHGRGVARAGKNGARLPPVRRVALGALLAADAVLVLALTLRATYDAARVDGWEDFVLGASAVVHLLAAVAAATVATALATGLPWGWTANALVQFGAATVGLEAILVGLPVGSRLAAQVVAFGLGAVAAAVAWSGPPASADRADLRTPV